MGFTESVKDNDLKIEDTPIALPDDLQKVEVKTEEAKTEVVSPPV